MGEFEYIDVDNDEFVEAPRALRDHVKKLQDSLKAVSSERDTYKTQAVSSSLGDVLTGFKNPERVKRDLLSDKIDPLDSEAVGKWIQENGGDYAQGDGAAPPQTPHGGDEAAFKRMQSTPLSEPSGMSALEAAQAEITPDMRGDQIREVYRRHGL